MQDTSLLGGDIFVPDLQYRNRGVHGDVVAVELLKERDWAFPGAQLSANDDESESKYSL